MKAEPRLPEVGDLVQYPADNPASKWVVTDIERHQVWVLRPLYGLGLQELHGCPRLGVDALGSVTVIARRGAWSQP